MIAQTNGDADHDDELRMLIDIVGRRDALFTPWRTPTKDRICQAFTAIRQRQDDYLAGSRGINAKAASRSEWKDAHFLRRALIDKGWATATSAGGQITSLLISEHGDAIAQAAISKTHDTVADGMPYFAMLRRYGPLSESTLNQQELHGNVSEWASFTELLMPFLVRGLIVASSDTQGRLFYSAGAGDPVEPLAVSQDVKEWAFAAYFSSYHSERTSLELITYEGGEVWIPVPAGFASMNTFTELENANSEKQNETL